MELSATMASINFPVFDRLFENYLMLFVNFSMPLFEFSRRGSDFDNEGDCFELRFFYLELCIFNYNQLIDMIYLNSLLNWREFYE